MAQINEDNPQKQKQTHLIKAGRSVKQLWLDALHWLIRLLCPIQDKAVFQSFRGKFYACNPRAISEELHRQSPATRIVWLFKHPQEKNVPDYVHRARSGSLRALYEMTTARYWVDNFNKPHHTRKRPGQIYIQTWHGDRSFKKTLYDSPTWEKTTRYIEADICNAITVGSNFAIRKLTSAFAYHNQFLPYGCPRNDKLIRNDPEEKQRVKTALDLPPESKVLLYAPTFRNEALNSVQEIRHLHLPAILDALRAASGTEWVCLTRAHSNTKGLHFAHGQQADILDVSAYEETADLFLITDFLITDYSSVAGDFALMGKPILLFQPDKEEYISRDRTLYFDIDQSPYLVASSQEELLASIAQYDEDFYKQNCAEILKFYDTFESGQASRKVVQFMLASAGMERHPETNQ